MEDNTAPVTPSSAPDAEISNGNALPPFGWKDKIGYALGDFGCNLSFALISAFMVDFYTQYIGIPSAAWAIIIIMTKVWDGVNDPIMGGIMDAIHVKNAKSKFKPWMSIGAIGLIVSGALVFLPIPNAATWVKITVCVVTYLLWDICYTLLNVPYGALSSAITGNPIERTQLSTWRSIGAAIGGALCVVLPMFVYDDNNNIMGGRLIWIGIILGAIAYVAYMFCLKLTTERVAVPKAEKQKFNYIKTLKGFLKNRPLLGLCLASFAQIVFLMSCTQTAKWLFQVHFGNADVMVTVATVIAYLPMVFFIPFTSRIVKKIGTKLAVAVPLFLSLIASLVMMFVPMPANTAGTVTFIVGLMLVQTGGGLFSLLAWAMVNDCIDYQQIKTGMREEGSVYALYSLFRKISQGVALSLPLLCMEAVGYDANVKPITAQDPGVAERMVMVSFVLMFVGAALMLAAFFLVYNLGKKQVEEISLKLGKTNEITLTDVLNESGDKD